MKTEIPGRPHDFILQLASLRTLNRTMKAVYEYREKGIDVHWNPVDLGEKGRWHRVYTGKFVTKEAAMAFKMTKELSEGIVVFAPWTILVTASDGDDDLKEKCAVIRKIGYDCDLAGDEKTGYEITAGAFVSFEGAIKMAHEIAELGFDAKVIRRESRS